jgi:16S rRNA (guanine(527)-N(7))-methyltransferase RsmG
MMADQVDLGETQCQLEFLVVRSLIFGKIVMSPSRDSLQEIIERCGIRLEPRHYDLLWNYHRLLRAADAELNLTRIRQFENMVLKHYVDSLLVLRFTELPSPIVDMGSGPGLPGIPIKIVRPELRMILAEPRGARVDFLRQVCDQLGLEGVEVHAGKVGPRFDRQVSGVITRAVATIPDTFDRVAHCLEPGGQMLFMKGPDCDQEMADASRSHANHFRLLADHPYSIPGTTHDRRLLIYERLDVPAPKVFDLTPSATPSTHKGPVREVTSASNPSFKSCRDALTGRGIRKSGRAILAGPRPIAEVLSRFPDRADAWITLLDGPAPPAEATPELTWLRLSKTLFQELDLAGTHAPLLLVKVPEIPDWSSDSPWPSGCTLFLPFQDPENVGSVLRSAAAFGVSRVVLLREAAHPFHPKSARAAGPTLFQVPLLRGPSIQELDSQSVPLIPLDADGEDLNAHPWPERFGLVPGVEGPGLPQNLRTLHKRRIPIAEGIESLNAATATAIALYDWRNRLSNS